MVELYERLKALEKQATEKSKTTTKADFDKRAAWDRIQQQPELAQFLSKCKAAFGKPESIAIEIDGNEIWRQP